MGRWWIAALALALAGCASSPTASSPGTVPAVTTSDTPTTVATATATSAPTTTSTSTTTSTTTTLPPVRTADDAPPGPPEPEPEPDPPRFTDADPLVVWVIGDSLAGPVGYVLDEMVEGLPVRVLVEHVGGSGLANTSWYDWPETIADRLPEVRPDVVVMHVGANDTQGITTPDGWAGFGSEGWDAAYTGRTAAVMDQLAALGPRVYWVGPPVMGNPDFTAELAHLATLQEAAAAGRTTVVFVDAGPLLAGEDGGFAASLPGPDGAPVRVRQPDGIHYTAAGARLVADEVWRRIYLDTRLWR